jgi:hypothetical protein
MSHDVIARLQQIIERLHGASADLDVRLYLVAQAVWRDMPGARAGMLEQLLVREAPDEMELGLYLDPQVVESLRRDDPSRRLHPGNLELFCIALEGVSHFVFVAWCARMGRAVSALELEIQAEVDKFVGAWLLLSQQGRPLAVSAPPLLRQLFDGYELRDEVALEESERYVLASRVAERFCGRLVGLFGHDRDTRRIERAVRRFVRQGMPEKLRQAA